MERSNNLWKWSNNRCNGRYDSRSVTGLRGAVVDSNSITTIMRDTTAIYDGYL